MWSADPLSPQYLGVAALLAGLGIVLSAAVTGNERILRGRVEKMGAGTVQSFVTLDPDGAPTAIGVTMSAGALEQLPPVPNSVSRCFDLNGDGRHTGHECIGDEERILDVPVGPVRRTPVPLDLGQLESRRPPQHALCPAPLRLSLPHRRSGAESRPSPPDVAASWRTAATSRLPPARSRPNTSPAATSTSAPWCRAWGTTCSTRSRPSSRIRSRSPARSSMGPTTAS